MSMSTLQTLRITVAALRQVTEETQAQLAAGIHLTQDKVSRRQSGASAWTLDDVDNLAAHWNLDVLELLAGPTRAAQAYAAKHHHTTGAAPAVPASFTPAPAPAATAGPAAAPAPRPHLQQDTPPRRTTRTEPYSPVTPVPDSWVRPGRRADAPVQPAAPESVAEQAAAGEHAAAAAAEPVALAVVVEFDRGPDGELLLVDPAPCVRCGRPTPYRAGGRPLHGGGWCTPAPGAAAAPAPAPAVGETAVPAPDNLAEGARQAVQAAVEQPPASMPAPAAEAGQQPAPAASAPAAAPTPAVPEPQPAPAPAPAAEAEQQPPAPPSPAAAPRSGPAGADEAQAASLAELLDLIRRPVERELARHGGDVDAATAALIRKAIPDAMALLAVSRVGARYEHTDHPPLPDILKKASKASADQVWEARPKWKNTALIKSTESALTVSALDMNGAYLSALKSHLPIGKLSHNTSGEWDPKQAGLYLATPPAWDHPDLPNPIGNRDEPGPLWLTSSTMRMLQRLAGPKLSLCEPPVIHEAFTAYSTENILENFRKALAAARDTAIAENDAVTLEYVKAMYSKFVSTIGLSTANHKMKRPDWMHIIRAQAFANLWWKGLKARDAGLTVVQMMGTDELHLIGDWRTVFPEGRKVTEVKLKDTYTIGGK